MKPLPSGTKLKWLERKKAALCICLSLCAVSVFSIINSQEKINENKGGSFAIKIRHYGIDAEEMEKSITIPLEDALSAIQGISSVQSSSENSLSSVFIKFKPAQRNKRNRGYYEAVRDAVQRVYETLPSSVQKPEILSSNNSRVPVWSASVYAEDTNAAQLLEKSVKPKLESLEGAGEIIVSGVGSEQIYIILDQEKLNLTGLNSLAVAYALGMNDSVFSAGSIVHNDKEIIVTVDGRYENNTLQKALIPIENGKYIELSDIAVIVKREREPDILSRLNGKKTAGIAVMPGHDANLRKLSLDIKKEIASLDLPFEFIVLSDLGAEESKAFRSVLNAAITGAFMVAFISFLLNKTIFRGVFCAFSILFICVISIAFISNFGISIDRLMLAGIAVGVGTSVDAVILCSEKIRLCKNIKEASSALKELRGPLIAGAMTTSVALLPLIGIEDNGVKIIAVSIAVMCIISLVISLVFLPPLLLWQREKPASAGKILNYKLVKTKNYLTGRISQFFCRCLAVNIRFCIRYPLIVCGSCLFLVIIAVFAFINKGVDTAGYNSENSIYAQIEFDSGLLPEEVDRLLAAYGEQLSNNTGIKNVETGARTGSGSLLVSFDPKIINVNQVRDLAKNIYIKGGFVFFHENSSRERYWEIKVYGDEDKKCREIAEELARSVIANPIALDSVLNFKQGSKKLVLLPDREKFTEGGIVFSSAAANIRSGVYGPVAYKRMESLQGKPEKEIDVRILSGNTDFYQLDNLRQSRDGTLNLLVSGKDNNSFQIDSVMQTKEETEPASIRRDNRRRTASITITTKQMDPRKAKRELASLFNKIDLPPGYSIEFDPDAIKQAQAISATVLSLVMAVLFCYGIIASINESFLIPVIVLAVIPPSLSVPAIFIALSGSAYNLAIACAFIAVSGMTVNTAVLCADGLALSMQKLKAKSKEDFSSFKIYPALRKKMPALIATTATTVAGAVPFLFLREEANTLIRTISLVGALGISCSCFFSITVIPSIFILLKNRFRLSGI